MRILIVVFVLLAGFENYSAQSFSWDSCQSYYMKYQDHKLNNYLQKTKNDLAKIDKIKHHYFSARYYRDQLDHELCMRHLISGYDLTQQGIVADSLKWKYLDEFAMIHRQSRLLNKTLALDYINESIKLKRKSGASNNELAKSYMIKGSLLFTSDFAVDSAHYYYKRAYELNTLKANKYLLLLNVAKTSVAIGQLDSVEQKFKALQRYFGQIRNKRLRTSTDLGLVSYYLKTDDTIRAKRMLDTLITLSTQNQWLSELKVAQELNYKLALSTGNYKSALIWKERYDQFESNNLKKDITLLTEKYTLENELAKANTRTYKNKLWLAILGGISAVLVLLLFGLFKYLNLKKQKVEQALEASKMKAAFEATRAKMEGEQKEREHIASVLHDQVASLLTAADMHLKAAQKREPLQIGLSRAGNIIKDINVHVRDLSHQLMSPSLIKFGLEAGLESLIDKMQSEELYISFESDIGITRYSSALETFIHQSCSEFIQNVIKHSLATHCKVSLNRRENMIRLKVMDNGDNRDIPQKAPTGLGLSHIKSRAAAHGGHFKFTLKPSGAVSVLELPAENSAVKDN